MDGAEVVEIGTGPSGVEEPVIESFTIDPTDGGIPTIDPATATGEYIPGQSGEDAPKRRGRPRGSKNYAGGKQSQKEVSSDLTTLLYSIHLILSKSLKIEELELDQDEAEQLGKALARVQKEFGVGVIPPKVAALLNLAVVGGGIYVPRVVAMANNAKKNKAEKPPQVINMPSRMM
jgi:hypothetical protein